MKKLDFKWQEDERWWHYSDDGRVVIHKDAPNEVKESYAHYLSQLKEKQ